MTIGKNMSLRTQGVSRIGRYLMVVVYMTRGSSLGTGTLADRAFCQFSELQLFDADGGRFSLPQGTRSYTCSSDGVNYEESTSGGEGLVMAFDGSVYTKFCALSFSSELQQITPISESLPLSVFLDFGDEVDLGVYKTLKLYSANDVPGRDPLSFALYVSSDHPYQGGKLVEMYRKTMTASEFTTNRRSLALTDRLWGE